MGLVYPLHNRLAKGLVTLFGSLMRLDHKKQLNLYILQRHAYHYLQHLYRYLRFPHYRKLKAELKMKPGNPNEGAMASSTILRLKTLYEYKLSLGIERAGTNEQFKYGRIRNKTGFGFLRLDSTFPDPIFPAAEVLRQDYSAVYDWIAMRYVPADFYSGKITFLWDSDDPYKAGWRKATEDNEVEVYVLPGSQLASRTTYLHVLSERLRICLSKTQEI